MIRLGFARGIAPSKWAQRYAESVTDQTLELVPIDATFGREPIPALARRPSTDTAPVDVMLERTQADTEPDDASRHAIRLYTEAIALVIPRDHELAALASIDAAELPLVTLLDHPDHAASWPRPEPWADASFRPHHAAAALDLVAAGLGGILLPRPLARHLSNKRDHAIVLLTGEELPRGTSIWATWAKDHDTTDVQQLIGVLRGRSPRSSRGTDHKPPLDRQPRVQKRQSPERAKPKLNPNSRGAQLAAAREKPTGKGTRKRRS